MPAPDRDRAVLAALLVLACTLTVGALAQGGGQMWGVPVRPFCEPGESPTFVFGFRALSQELGAVMGRPLECEHGDPMTGNTVQRTSTGQAVYYVCTNTPVFSRDAEHWALTPSGIVNWEDQHDDPRAALPLTVTPDLRRPCVGSRR